ncbi:MAG: sulfotransferase domain-containing protein [Bacteroidota bacterium]|nr:sulfotransferase domain-containing protein [Bacteroidota bacterium]
MKVNLLIIGAGRSGTTSLCEHLKHHPEICFSTIKEIPFFSIEKIYQRGYKYYHSFFKHPEKPVIASSDTYLLIDQKAPERIKQYNPDMKIIILLREPVERAYSSYIYAINNGHQNKEIGLKESFLKEKDFINQKDIVTRNNLGHFYSGLYYKHIKYWMKFFPKENFLLLKTSELQTHTSKTLSTISSFLGISDFKNMNELHINKASGVKSMFLHRFFIDRNNSIRKFFGFITPVFIKKIVFNSGIIEKINQLNTKETNYSKLSEEDKKMATPYFAEDLKNLKKEFDITF